MWIQIIEESWQQAAIAYIKRLEAEMEEVTWW